MKRIKKDDVELKGEISLKEEVIAAYIPAFWQQQWCGCLHPF